MCSVCTQKTQLLDTRTNEAQMQLDVPQQQQSYGGTRLAMQWPNPPDARTLVHKRTHLHKGKLFASTPNIFCPVSYSEDCFCIQSYLVCPISYAVLSLWRLSSATCWPSCPHFIKALTCEDTSGPASLEVQHWLKCITGLEPACLACDTISFLGFLDCYAWKHFILWMLLYCQRYCANKSIRVLLLLMNESIH